MFSMKYSMDMVFDDRISLSKFAQRRNLFECQKTDSNDI